MSPLPPAPVVIYSEPRRSSLLPRILLFVLLVAGLCIAVSVYCPADQDIFLRETGTIQPDTVASPSPPTQPAVENKKEQVGQKSPVIISAQESAKPVPVPQPTQVAAKPSFRQRLAKFCSGLIPTRRTMRIIGLLLIVSSLCCYTALLYLAIRSGEIVIPFSFDDATKLAEEHLAKAKVMAVVIRNLVEEAVSPYLEEVLASAYYKQAEHMASLAVQAVRDVAAAVSDKVCMLVPNIVGKGPTDAELGVPIVAPGAFADAPANPPGSFTDAPSVDISGVF